MSIINSLESIKQILQSISQLKSIHYMNIDYIKNPPIAIMPFAGISFSESTYATTLHGNQHIPKRYYTIAVFINMQRQTLQTSIDKYTLIQKIQRLLINNSRIRLTSSTTIILKNNCHMHLIQLEYIDKKQIISGSTS